MINWVKLAHEKLYRLKHQRWARPRKDFIFVILSQYKKGGNISVKQELTR